MKLAITGVVALAVCFATRLGRADAAFDAALAAELEFGKQQATLDQRKVELDAEWDKLVQAVVGSKGQDPGLAKSVTEFCQNATATWCDKVKKDEETWFVRPKGDSLEYPLQEWCDAKNIPNAVNVAACKEFVRARDAHSAQAQKVREARSKREQVHFEYSRSSAPAPTLDDRLAGSRSARCATAYCFGGTDGTKFAFEPMIELPIGLTWATGSGALANHINASGLDVRLNAGIRFWMAYDLFSAAVLLFQPSLASSREVVVPGASQAFGSEAIRRPYPSFSLGFAGDIFMLTVSYDQLRNVRSNGNVDPNFLPNEVLSRSFTFGLYLAPITAARNGIGAATATAGGNK